MPQPLIFAAIFAGAVAAAAISGAVGFGGALLLLPLLARTEGPELAVPLLTFAQLVGNASRAVFGLHAIAWRLAIFFLVTAIPASIAGSYCFLALPKSLVTRLVGAALLLFVVLKLRGPSAMRLAGWRLAVAGAVVGFLSGLVGSAGPLGAAAFLSLDLAPVTYIATEASTAVAMHATKMLVYGRHVTLDERAWTMAALLAVAMILGSWIGKRSVERLSAEKFRVVVAVLLAAIGLQMLIMG
jgi:uncharacterized membrane protein YfcA